MTANFKIWQGVDSYRCWETECATHPGIEPHCAHSHWCGLSLLSHLPKNPQPTPRGRKQGQRTHGLTQHNFFYCCPEGRNSTQAATPCIPKVAEAEQHQAHGKKSLWANPSSASTSTRWFLTAVHTPTPTSVFPPLETGIPARTGWLGQHPCVTHARCVNPWNKKGESLVRVWRQSGLEQLLRARIFVCNGFTKCSIQIYRTVTPLRAETHWEKDWLSQVTLPETSDIV